MADSVAAAVTESTSQTAQLPLEHIHGIPNLLTLLRNWLFRDHPEIFQLLKTIEPTFFSLIAVLILALVAIGTSRRMQLRPGRLQMVGELAVEGFYDFLTNIMGGREHARRHLPFIGSLFFFILVNNMLGITPLAMAPTSMFQTTFALALCTFLYVQFWAIRMNGPFGYVYHLMGSPTSPIMWVFGVLLLPLEILGEVIKPISLSLRLFGNITGEDILLYVVSFLGVTMFFFGCPLQLPFIFLSMLLGTVQAVVFTLLAMIYITLFIPHEHANT